MNAVFRAFADPTRREILDQLARKPEESVMELAKDFHMTLPAVSQHLKLRVDLDRAIDRLGAKGVGDA